MTTDDDFGPATAAPAPGDPRDPGPRPRPTVRDLAWGTLTGGLVAVTAVQFVVLTVALLRLEVRPSTGGLFVGFLITVVWLLTIHWLALGAWRRSVWGCPFHHTTRGADARRCVRHALVPHDDDRDAP